MTCWLFFCLFYFSFCPPFLHAPFIVGKLVFTCQILNPSNVRAPVKLPINIQFVYVETRSFFLCSAVASLLGLVFFIVYVFLEETGHSSQIGYLVVLFFGFSLVLYLCNVKILVLLGRVVWILFLFFWPIRCTQWKVIVLMVVMGSFREECKNSGFSCVVSGTPERIKLSRILRHWRSRMVTFIWIFSEVRLLICVVRADIFVCRSLFWVWNVSI